MGGYLKDLMERKPYQSCVCVSVCVGERKREQASVCVCGLLCVKETKVFLSTSQASAVQVLFTNGTH